MAMMKEKKILKKYSNNIITFKKRFIRIINIMILITVISIIMNINEIVINQLTNNNFISLNCMDTKICNREKKFHYPNFFVKGYTVNNIQNNKALQSKKENIESIMSNFEESIKDYKNHSVNRFTIKSYFDDKLSNVNIIDCNGNTPLVYAVKNQSLPIVEALINKGADVNYLIKKNNSDYNTIKLIFNLIEENKKNGNKILKKLLDANLNPNTRNSDKQNLLDFALIHNNYEIFLYLLERRFIDFNKQNLSFYHVAKIIQERKLDLLKILINNKILNLKKFSKLDNKNLLDFALKTNEYKIYSFLLEQGLTDYNPNNISFHHIMTIIKNERFDLLKILVKHNVDLKKLIKLCPKTLLSFAKYLLKTNFTRIFNNCNKLIIEKILYSLNKWNESSLVRIFINILKNMKK